MMNGEWVQWSPALDSVVVDNTHWTAKYNTEGMAMDKEERYAMLKAKLGAIGLDSQIRPPFYCNFT